MIWGIFLLGVLIYLTLQILYSLYYFTKGTQLAKASFSGIGELGDRSKPKFRLFIAGDSVGAGVGATNFEKSASGRLVEHFSKSYLVEWVNVSVSGNKMADLLMNPLPGEKQDLIVLIVSSNNLFRLTGLKQFKLDTKSVLERFSPYTERLVLIGPGRVADSQAIPLFMKPVYKIFGSKYADILRLETKNYQNVTHVNPQIHLAQKQSYGYTLAEDKFHPNDSGHKFWFDLIVDALEKKTG
jgi:lysophospholipase L1-like esterase